LPYCNFHAHDHGSINDGGTGTPQQRVEAAKAIGQDTLSISNHGNLITVPDHLVACRENGIKPIVGMEAYFKPDRFKQDPENKKNHHLLLTAKNQEGFNNLIKISSEAHTSGFYHKPCIDYQLLSDNSAGLICSSSCIIGYLSWAIQQGDDRLIDEIITRHTDIFGDDYYLEIMPHNVPAQKIVNLALQQLSADYDVPLLATNDSHYPFKDWKDTSDVMLMICTGQTVAKRKAKEDKGEEVYEVDLPLHMFSENEMWQEFQRHHPDLDDREVRKALEISEKIASEIEDVALDTAPKIPKIKSDKPSLDVLREWVNEGLARIGKTDDDEYIERAKYELSVIEKFEVEDYFVLVAKMVRWARDQGIRISSGRGSAAGSLVCYLTKITTIDPIAHGLIFERFLNPDRKGLPDIDLDFQADRIHEVKEWVAKEYGEGRVYDIGSFGTFNPKGAIKDVARVLNIDYSETNSVTKLIPDASDVGGAGNVPPLAKLKEDNAFVKEYAEKYPEVWKHAIRLEGQIKQLSKHAAGIIVSDRPLNNYIPIVKGKHSFVSSWTARAEHDVISEMNLLKIDLLSLDGLTKQGNTIQMIEDIYGKRIDLDELPVVSDPSAVEQDVMRQFQKGLTLGIFQFGGGRGISNFLKHVKPDRFEDLVAVNALYRPGGLGGGDAFKYGDVKQGKLPIEYWHESIIPYLKETYGILVYQEQLQQIAQALGNFSPGESDDLRKATSKMYRMGKKKAQEFIQGYYETWLKGCQENGLDQDRADYIWERMLAMGAYTFNKSHSSSYALAAYQDAWLKYHHPQAFYASLLTNEAEEKSDQIIAEAKQLDVKILPPNINDSDVGFTIVDNNLLYGLAAIKYVGGAAINELQHHRPFSSFEDLEQRVPKQKVNKRVKEYLIKSGALDIFNMRDSWSVEEKRNAEIESMGVALSGSGELEKYADIIEERCNTEEEFDRMDDGAGLTVGGEIISVKEIIVKRGKYKGKPMGFVNLSYGINQYECTFFTSQYMKYKKYLKVGTPVLVMGKKSDRGQTIVLKMTTAEKLKEALNQ
jgi:DNA polymerase-3 subunit alpha